MPFPASDVVMTLVRDWVRKGMSRPKFCCPMGSFFCIIITLLRLFRGLPRFTAFTMAASMLSTSMAVSAEAVSVAESAAVLLELFAVLLELMAGVLERFAVLLELVLILFCCAETTLIDKPIREISALKMRCFFMDEVFFHPEHSQRGGDISLRRHYPDQVGGYDLSALLEAPRMMSQR